MPCTANGPLRAASGHHCGLAPADTSRAAGSRSLAGSRAALETEALSPIPTIGTTQMTLMQTIKAFQGPARTYLVHNFGVAAGLKLATLATGLFLALFWVRGQQLQAGRHIRSAELAMTRDLARRIRPLHRRRVTSSRPRPNALPTGSRASPTRSAP